ncbi:MAG: phosphotransferase [Caldilinea sp.]
MSTAPLPVLETPPMARVLVIDNREQVRRDLKRGLESRGYQVIVVEGEGERLHKNAMDLACDFRPHVAIVDLRLEDDGDMSDTSGLMLLSKLRKKSEGLGMIAYSAYLTPTVDRKINELAAEWVEKSDEPRVLKEAVDKLAAQSCASSRPFTVTWPKEWEKADAVLKVFDAEFLPSLLDDVIAQLFEHGKRVWIHEIEESTQSSSPPVSRGRSLVIKVQQQGSVTKKIVKISTPKRVRNEARHYQKFIHERLPGQFHTRLEASRTFWDVGASVYTLLGDDEITSLRTLRNFYAAEHDVQRLLAPIRFWQKIWGRAHAVKGYRKNLSIAEQYEELLDLQNNLQRIRETPRPAVLAALALLDPLLWWEERGHAYAARPGVRQVIHGDFHADNLFTDGERAWLVDFERTGYGPIYADFCELEIDILTRLLPASVPVEEFVRLATALADVSANTAPAALSDEARKAMEFVRGLRELAFASTHPAQAAAYQWGLLCDALFVAGMRPSLHNLKEQSAQQERAWLYASILCPCIEATQKLEAVRP